MRISTTALIAVATLAGSARADTAINFFGDVDYYVDHDGRTSNSFQAPDLDIFAMQTDGKFAFVGEVIVEAFGKNGFDIDADRLEVDYKPLAWLHFRAGRIRSAFGYYGDAYQNGKFFMLAAGPPEMYEGNGFDGIVPSHTIGLHGDASYELGHERGRMTVDAEVVNGRGPDLDTVTAFQDQGNHKGVDVRLRYVGEGVLDGLIVGGNVYDDLIPLDNTPGSMNPEEAELILGAHAVYMSDRVHVIAEAAWFRDRESVSQLLHSTVAAFGEAGYGFGDFMPYLRFEYLHINSVPDPYFVTSGFPTYDHEIITAGVKYTATASIAFKLQGSATLQPGTDDYRALAQAAFAF
jgi:hypothetical protein